MLKCYQHDQQEAQGYRFKPPRSVLFCLIETYRFLWYLLPALYTAARLIAAVEVSGY